MCVHDPDGQFENVEECNQECESSIPAELAYDLKIALAYSARDRVNAIRRAIGVTVPFRDSYRIIEAMVSDNVPVIYEYPVLHEWLSEKYDDTVMDLAELYTDLLVTL